jgi:dienelactone hydrolase
MKRFRPSFEQFESRVLPTLVFVFNGNAFARSSPDSAHTQLAAALLMADGDRAVQLATPPMNSPRDFDQLAASIFAISKGRPIGLMGFSAGGALAMRLSQVPKLNVKAVMNYYGPPDLRDWLNFHRGDRYYNRVVTHVRFSPGIIALLSGPSKSTAFIVSAFGRDDRIIVSSVSTASFHRDFQQGQVFTYAGGHGVTVYADLGAFRVFLSHLR